jgi:23S rRNA (cytosine1962-C5)-methyltransferase
LSSSSAGRGGIVLQPGRDGPVRHRRHPWIYSQAIAKAEEEAPPGSLLPVRASDGSLVGWGHYSAGSLIAVRMASFSADEPAADWIEQRLRAAWDLRARLGLDTDAFRVANAEGDFLPGLVVDLYADTAVICPHTRNMEALVERIRDCLCALRSDLKLYLRRDEHFARVEKLRAASGYLHGTGDGTTVIREGGVPLKVDFARGQKTGFYLDQRANRTLIARSARGKAVLNLFSYSGAVAMRAAAAGAAKVVSVDSSRTALDLAAASAALSPGLPAGMFEWVQSDVFSYLESPAACDIVVADPPPFARRRVERDGAIQGYLSLFAQCLRILPPGGIAFLFSCSGAIDRPTFQHIVSEAAVRAGRDARLLLELHADADHPVSSAHPEGEYLKGWMVHVQ